MSGFLIIIYRSSFVYTYIDACTSIHTHIIHTSVNVVIGDNGDKPRVLLFSVSHLERELNVFLYYPSKL